MGERRRTSTTRVTLVVAVALAATRLAGAAPFNPGDVFTSINHALVQHWSGDGELLETFDIGGNPAWLISPAGCAVDAAGNLHVAGKTTGDIRRLSGPGDPHVLTAWGGTPAYPSSVTFDHAGNAYAGNGCYIAAYSVTGSPNGAFGAECSTALSVDVAPDDCTLFYTTLGRSEVRRWDVCRRARLPDFSSIDVERRLERALTVRVLGDGSVLVTTAAEILRLGADGRVIQGYDVPGEDGWMPLGLDPNGSSFWAGDLYSGRFYRFDIGSGVVERGPFETHATASPGVDFSALCVAGEDAAVPRWTTTTVATSTTTTTLDPAGNRPPDCSTAVGELRRRRKAGRLVAVRIRGVTDPDGGPVRVHITAARVAAAAVGTTCPTPRGVGTRTAWLRAARAGADDDRVYRLWLRAKDRHGAVCRGFVDVCVPPSGRAACRERAGVERAGACP